MTLLTHPNKPEWFDDLAVLSANPGRLIELMGRSFEIVRPFDSPGAELPLESDNEQPRYEREPWIVGACGVVCDLTFGSRTGWGVRIEYQGDWSDITHDQIWIELSVGEFLHHSRPLGSPDLEKGHLGREAANDPE